MTIEIQPPTPLTRKFPGDTNINQHDKDLQILYEAVLELQRKVAALESGS